MESKIEKVLALCEQGTTAVTEYRGSKTKITVKCTEGHLREITPDKLLSRSTNATCKICTPYIHGLAKSSKTFAKEALEMGLEVLEPYSKSSVPILARNILCGHEYLINPNSLVTKGTGKICRICIPSHKKLLPDITRELLDNGLELLGEYLGTSVRTKVRNIKCEHTYDIEPSSVVSKGIGSICRVCNPANLKSLEEVHAELKELGLELVGEYLGTRSDIELRNTKCGHIYKILATNVFSKHQGSICPECYPHTSMQEMEVLDFIKSKYNGWIVHGDRDILGGKELDIVLPDLGLAIEYDGVYWHKEGDKRDKEYHKNKTIKVDAFGYTLIHLREDEWMNKRPIVKSRICAMLGLSDKVYARKTTVREIKYPREFLDTNHIQGAGAPSSVNYGLFLQEELVAVMTFSKPRYAKQYDFELIRFCSLLDITVVGGASKLLKQFRKDYPNTTLITYSDKRWSKGNLYKTLGFTYSHTGPINYRYYKGLKSYSRYQCQKHLLKDLMPKFYKEELREEDIMAAAGYFKVHDCGNDTWILK